jgi:DNA-binding IclR family transcriptional regulator
MPMGRGAIARSIIAFLPRRHILPRIEASLEDLRSVGLGATVEEIHDSLKRVRKAGYAVAKGEVTPGVVGVAAPVFDAGQSPIASLCVTIAAELVDTKVVEEIGTCVREAAASLSAELSADRRAPAERQRVREG